MVVVNRLLVGAVSVSVSVPVPVPVSVSVSAVGDSVEGCGSRDSSLAATDALELASSESLISFLLLLMLSFMPKLLMLIP